MLQQFAVAAVVRVVRGNFGPESVRVIHVIDVGEFVQNDVVAKRFRNFHEANVK